MKTETCKLYSRVFWIFLSNVIGIDHYDFELYHFKVAAFFETQCIWALLLCEVVSHHVFLLRYLYLITLSTPEGQWLGGCHVSEMFDSCWLWHCVVCWLLDLLQHVSYIIKHCGSESSFTQCACSRTSAFSTFRFSNAAPSLDYHHFFFIQRFQLWHFVSFSHHCRLCVYCNKVNGSGHLYKTHFKPFYTYRKNPFIYASFLFGDFCKVNRIKGHVCWYQLLLMFGIWNENLILARH